MDAITLLLKEHEKVRKILDDISDESHRDETKRNMFDSLCEDLIKHETMEEKIWYPYLKKNLHLNTVISHLISEEKSAEKAIAKFANVSTQEEWEEKFKKFKKDVEHHAKEEEQKLFPKVAEHLEKSELEVLGKEMREFKERL